jgi:hypothetical protein
MSSQGKEYQDNTQPEVQQNSEFRLYTPEDNRDSRLASAYDRELNEISSAPSTVYLLDDKPFDTLYGEDTSPQFSSAFTGLVGLYQPNPVDFQLNKWGLDAENIDMLIMFNKEELDDKLPRAIDVGDLIVDVYNRVYEVTFTKNDSNFRFSFITQYVLCKRRLGDLPQLLDRTTKVHTDEKTVRQEPDPLYGE